MALNHLFLPAIIGIVLICYGLYRIIKAAVKDALREFFEERETKDGPQQY